MEYTLKFILIGDSFVGKTCLLGKFLNRIFISPAQHQIHHSKALKHRDKNLGGQLAIWDWIFGTIYLPDKKEDIQFGVGDGEDWKYQSPWQLFILPFKKNLGDPIRRYFISVSINTNSKSLALMTSCSTPASRK